jgi:hypothetical protein
MGACHCRLLMVCGDYVGEICSLHVCGHLKRIFDVRILKVRVVRDGLEVGVSADILDIVCDARSNDVVGHHHGALARKSRWHSRQRHDIIPIWKHAAVPIEADRSAR